MIPSPQRAGFSFWVINHFPTLRFFLSATLVGPLILCAQNSPSPAQSDSLPEPAQNSVVIPAQITDPAKPSEDKPEEVSTWIRAFVDRSGTEDLRLRAAAQLERAGLAEKVLPAFLAVLKNPREKMSMRRVALDLALRTAQQQALVLDDLSQLLFDEQTGVDFKDYLAEQMAAMTLEWASAAQGSSAARERALNWINSFERSLARAGMEPQPSIAAARQVLASQPGWLDWMNDYLALAGISLGLGVVAGAWVMASRFRKGESSSPLRPEEKQDTEVPTVHPPLLNALPTEWRSPEAPAGAPEPPEPLETSVTQEFSGSDLASPSKLEQPSPTPLPEPTAPQPGAEGIAAIPNPILPAEPKAAVPNPIGSAVFSPAEIDHAIAALNAPVSVERRRAATQLALMGHQAESAVPALASRLADEQERLTVRQSAACALAEIAAPHPAAIKALLTVIINRERGLILSATRALVRIGSPALAALQEELCAPGQSSPSQEALLRAVGAFGTQAEELLPVLVTFLSDASASERVRCAAADAIGKMGSIADEYVPNLISAMAGGKHLCRSAANALVSMAPGARREIVTLFQMQQRHYRAEEQLAEYRLLSAWAPAEAGPVANVSPGVREHISRALEASRLEKASVVSENSDLSPWPTPSGDMKFLGN